MPSLKLVNTAQISFAERDLLYDQKQILTRMNNEAKVRWSTKSIVVGTAKVMSFEDIEVARATRAAEVIKGKGKRGRKRKSVAVEVDEPEPEVARMIDAPVPWRAHQLRGWYETIARKNRESFLISFSSDLVFGGRKSDIINVVAFSAQ
jgi:hypothetical protein